MDYSYEVIRSELIDIYGNIKTDKYLKKNYYNYRKLLLSLSDMKKKDNNGPLRYFSNDEILSLVNKYLDSYFNCYTKDFAKTTILMYDVDTLLKYSNASDEDKLNDEFKYISLTKEEAENLLIAKGVTDFVFNDIKVVNYKNISTSLSITHEYTHKIHNNNDNNNKYTEEWFIFSEYLAYYNELLFKEYLESLGYKSDVTIAINSNLITTRGQIKLFKLMDDLYHGKDVSLKDLIIIDASMELDNIPLYDYPHLIAYLASITKYEETKNLSLLDRTKELNELLSTSINSKAIKENYLDINDSETVKRLIMNFNK
ncbi:MAG TPA: hypothetical protein IAB38_02715 [Candidatus Onthousia excrementipullorum]|uniref:Uncharacterized protein n=1 Tax=Candidatus Onthousia excrementipullorum TaxID=2840884 RepID=A0A9D1DU83_9FIRM|nr:hypothetical protein [Candidatus Onthousia excrementipullorum]